MIDMFGIFLWLFKKQDDYCTIKIQLALTRIAANRGPSTRQISHCFFLGTMINYFLGHDELKKLESFLFTSLNA